MPKEITSLSDLRKEIALMETNQRIQEEQLRMRLKKMSEDLKPANLIKGAFTSIKQSSGLKNDTVIQVAEAALGFVISNLLFKKYGPLTRTIASVVGSSVATGMLGEHAGKYLEKFKNLIEKYRNRGQQNSFDEKDTFNQ